MKILDDQAERRQVLKMSEVEARRRFPELAVASLGAMRKEKPGMGSQSTRVLAYAIRSGDRSRRT